MLTAYEELLLRWLPTRVFMQGAEGLRLPRDDTGARGDREP